MVLVSSRNGLHNASEILDRRVEGGDGGRVAIRYGDESLTYSELHAEVGRFASGLVALGVKQEDRVLLVLDDSPAFPTAFLGAIRAGAVPVPVNPLYRAEDYRFFVEDSGAQLVVAGAEQLDKVIEALSGLDRPPRILATDTESEGVIPWRELVDAGTADTSAADTAGDSMAFWLYSSGSTGRPKAVVHGQRDLDATYETYGAHVLRISKDDITYSSSKMFHAYGLGNGITFPYSVGATTVIASGRPTPDAIFANIERHRPSLFFSVPTLYNAMLNSLGESRPDLSSVRACVSAAEALPPAVWQGWKDTFGLTILDGVGSTEMAHIYCSNSMEDPHPGSSGRPVPGYDLEIRGEDGLPLDTQEAGDLWVRGPSMLSGYWNRPDKTAASLQDGWFFTGDRYRADADGVYWYEGRADDMIRVGGLWVSPVDVENVLISHHAVVESAVVGTQVDGLSKVKAFVVLVSTVERSDELIKELQEWCKSHLQRYQFPHYVEFVDDLPKTVTGKIQRFKLR